MSIALVFGKNIFGSEELTRTVDARLLERRADVFDQLILINIRSYTLLRLFDNLLPHFGINVVLI